MFEKPTNAVLLQVVMDYYKGVMEKSGESGQMDPDTFRQQNYISWTVFKHVDLLARCIFRLAFPERPEAKLDILITKLANVEKTSGTIRKNEM